MEDIYSLEGSKRYMRDSPPAHFVFKIKSFSLLVKTQVEKYESSEFEAGGRKWKLVLYPNGNHKCNGNGFISLYLEIAEIEALPITWEVNVNYRLFVRDQIRDKYLTIEAKADGGVKRFNQMKRDWGFAQLLFLQSFNDPSKGFLVDDSCIFGAEVLVIERSDKGECFSMIKQPDNGTITLTIQNFSGLYQSLQESPVYTVEDSKWKLNIYPRGYETARSIALSAFLELVDANSLPPNRKVYAEYKFRIRDQLNLNHKELTDSCWFSASCTDWGCLQLISLKDLHDVSKGYIINDTLIVEAEIIVLSTVTCFP